MGIKALIFDLDGVIVATDELHYRSWRRLADEEGLTFDREVNARLLGRTRGDSLDIVAEGRPLTPKQRDDLLERKQQYFLQKAHNLSPTDILPGVERLLDEADRRGLPCAVASSSRNAHMVLARLGLTDRFAFIADGSATARPKPAPDIFLMVAERLGLPPAQCVVFEDSLAGVTAGHAEGFPVASVGLDTPLAQWRLDTLMDFSTDEFEFSTIDPA